MRRPVVVLAGFGGVLGGLGAVGWHWVPAFGERYGSPIRPRPGQLPLYSGVVTDDQVIHWVPLWWPVVLALPVLGAAVGAALGTLTVHRDAPDRAPGTEAPGRLAAVIDAVTVVLLGLLLGVASAAAWHWDPLLGAWKGGWVEDRVELGYPVVGCVLAVVFLAVVRPDGTWRWGGAVRSAGHRPTW